MKQVINYIKDFTLDRGQDSLFESSESTQTRINSVEIEGKNITQYINEFWTSKQRQASSIHEISYRACFKPQLPRFFITLLTEEGDTVFDPFAGRGTTAIEAALLNRNVISNDINPLSKILTYPRFFVPDYRDLKNVLEEFALDKNLSADTDLSMYYHPETEGEIVSLKNYLSRKRQNGVESHIDKWIRMIATSRLTGHSKGFFSVYTLPPNQATTPDRQRKINKKRDQSPPYKEIIPRILKKSKSLMRNIDDVKRKRLEKIGNEGLFLECDAGNTKAIPDNSIQLTVTSPPFLDIVQYDKDNWLRCWFNNINTDKMAEKITMSDDTDEWTDVMERVFRELYRITKDDGWVAFEVGEVKNGKIKLDEYIVPVGIKAGFECIGILVNMQEFTKTSNIWGVDNMDSGTNTNRIVLFRKNR